MCRSVFIAQTFCEWYAHRTVRTVGGNGATLAYEPMLILTLVQTGGVLILGKAERGRGLPRMPRQLFGLSTPRTIESAGPQKAIELVRIDSNAVTHPRNATGWNQTGSYPCVNCIHAEAIPRGKSRRPTPAYT